MMCDAVTNAPIPAPVELTNVCTPTPIIAAAWPAMLGQYAASRREGASEIHARIVIGY